MRNRGGSVGVGSGDLLGGSNMRGNSLGSRTSSGKTKVHEQREVRTPHNALDETPGPNVRTGTPIRGFEHLCTASGKGALNRAASYAALPFLFFFGITPDMTGRLGAETPNVKDEPRPQRARLVQKSAARSNLSNSSHVR